MLNKKSLRKFIVASFAVGALAFAPESQCLPIGTAVVHAEVKEYVGVGESIVSDRETIEIGKQGAKLQAIRNAQEKAGVYISSYSVMKNYELETDEVVAFTASIVKINDNVKYEPITLNDDLGTFKYRATVVVTIDTNDLTNQINAWLKRNARDRSNIVAQNKDLQNLVDQQAKRIKELEQTIAANKDKATDQQEITRIDNETQIIQKTADGNQAYYNGDYSTAAKNYSDLLKLKEFEFNGFGISGRRISSGQDRLRARAAAHLAAWREVAMQLNDYIDSRSPGSSSNEQLQQMLKDITRRSIITHEEYNNDDEVYSIKLKLRPEDVDKLQAYFER